MPKMIDPSAIERPIEKGDEWGAVDAFLAAVDAGLPLESLYLTAEHLGARRYDYETPAPTLPHGMITVNAAWGLREFVRGEDELMTFALAQGFANLAMEHRAFERARTIARRPVRGLAINDLANLVVEKVEKGDIAEADGAFASLIERSEGDRTLIARSFFTAGAQDLQNWGHKGTFAAHLWQFCERDGFQDIFNALRPGLHYFAAFGSRDEKRQIERHSAELDVGSVKHGRQLAGAQGEVEALANRMLAGGSTKAVVEALQGGFGLEDVVDASVLAACEAIRHSMKPQMAVEALAYAHSSRIAARATGPACLLPIFQAAAWVHECASTREVTPPPQRAPIVPRTAATFALVEDFHTSQGHLVKTTEAALSERAGGPGWMAGYLDAALMQATTIVPSSRTLLERFQDRLKVPEALRAVRLAPPA
ncbi:MAG TPA: hypothetical protein VGB42_07700 [Candidatus Thermoplasmatota archaeon]